MAKILAPVGSPSHVSDILSAGADHVYLGVPGLSREGRRGAKTADELFDALSRLDEPHRVHVALNVVPSKEALPYMYRTVEKLLEWGVERIILNDPGLVWEMRLKFPSISITASVGMTTSFVKSALFLEETGVTGVVLPTIASPEDVKAIKNACSLEVEILAYCRGEPLVHGTCMLAGFLLSGGDPKGRITRSAKKTGSCYTVCRAILPGKSPTDETDKIGEWLDSGVDFLKIEGRYRDVGEIKEIIARLKSSVESHFRSDENTSTSS